MAFRTVVISSHSKLEYSLNYLVYRTIEQTKKINLDEIHTLIIESTSVSITSALMVELISKKIKVIFCDEKRNPSFELAPYFEKIKEKINNQANNLRDNIEIYNMLIDFKTNVEPGDITNREGHAAKVYFNNIFGKDFVRGDNNPINKFLN